MSAIVKNKIGTHVYLYESESYRDENGKVKNNRRVIGKIDPLTGKYMYKPEYIEQKGIDLDKIDTNEVKLYSVNDVKKSIVKEFGVFYLLDEISTQIGLSDVLKEVLPSIWKEVLNLAFYIVASGEPALYCEDWLYKSECYESKEMSSQRISELLVTITQDDRMNFYEAWGRYRCEKEYVALDITSISSYSKLINDVEWGYNRDKEKLPQINVCLLLGEESKLPILQIEYSGSIKDVSTLKSTLETASNLSLDNMSLVMDKGFGSVKNINTMLSKKNSIRFVIAVPFTLTFAKKQVESERKDINCVDNTIVIGSDVLRGITKTRVWNSEHDIYTHIYLNTDTANEAQNKIYGNVRKIINEVKQDPEKHINKPDVKKYLNVRKSERSEIGYTINVKEEVILEELANEGWLVLVSNHIDNAEEAIGIYRSKDVVEKGFNHMKNCLNLARLRVHSDNAMENKLFIGFIALIITAHIHKIMEEHNFYDCWTMKKMIKILERLKIHYIKNDRIIVPLTKDQKLIFNAFGIKCVL